MTAGNVFQSLQVLKEKVDMYKCSFYDVLILRPDYIIPVMSLHVSEGLGADCVEQGGPVQSCRVMCQLQTSAA